jgi:hypothetical protein
MQPGAHAARRLTVVKDAKSKERFGCGPSSAKAAADVPACGEDECIRTESAIAGPGCDDAPSIHVKRCDLTRDCAESDGLLEPPPMRRRGRGEQLKAIVRKFRESRWIRDRLRLDAFTQGRSPPVQVREGRSGWQVFHGDLFCESFHAV